MAKTTNVIAEIPQTPTDKLTKVTENASGRDRVVLLLCGSFSPVTLAHVALLELARTALLARGYAVLGGYLSPVHDGYGKAGLAHATHRITMLRAATSSSSWLMVDSWEACQETPSPSYAVAEHLSAAVPDARVVFVCGADLAHAMADPACWPRRNVRRLASAATIAILRRAGAPDPPHAFEDADSFPRPTLVIDAPVLPGSSSDVRAHIAKRTTITQQVHKEVARYIQIHGLFNY